MCAMTSIRTVTINAAFLQEIKDVHQELWQTFGELDGMADSPLADRSGINRFAELLGRLRDQLALHFSLEEAYGYFDDPAEAAPQLCGQAERLREEHATLYVTVSELAERVEQAGFDGRPLDIDEVLEKYRTFCCEFRRHEDAETELIQQAYGDDIGVGD